MGHLKREAAPCHEGMGPKLNSDIKTQKRDKLDRECTNLKEKNGHQGMVGSVALVKRMKMGTMEVIHQIIPHIACLFNHKSRTILEFGYACIKETVSVTGNIHSIVLTLLFLLLRT